MAIEVSASTVLECIIAFLVLGTLLRWCVDEGIDWVEAMKRRAKRKKR